MSCKKCIPREAVMDATCWFRLRQRGLPPMLRRSGRLLGMFRHVVLFQFKEGVTAAETSALQEGLEALPSKIAQIRSYQVGPDAGISGPSNFNFAVVADFASKEDFQTYAVHHEHQRVVKELILPILKERSAVQYEIPNGRL